VVRPSRRLLSPFGLLLGYAQSWDGWNVKDFAYGQDWNGRFYTTKQVRPILVDEAHEIVVVTVYVYYFSEGRNP
jgi:hypothetical protein